MNKDIVLPFDLPSVARKKVSVGFDGGQLSSDAGVLLLRGVEKKLGLTDRLASCMRDRRNSTASSIRCRRCYSLECLQSRAGYEDADDCDCLRHDPIFKMAVGRLPEKVARRCARSLRCRGWRMRRRRSRSPD